MEQINSKMNKNKEIDNKIIFKPTVMPKLF